MLSFARRIVEVSLSNLVVCDWMAQLWCMLTVSSLPRTHGELYSLPLY